MREFTYINIREYLNEEDGEKELADLISAFSCPKNPGVEEFLKEDAIEFTKQHKSVTYLVFSDDNGVLVGYFTITIKPIAVNAAIISNSLEKKFSRMNPLDASSNTYTVAAFLIAQLGKNFYDNADKLISGDELLSLALSVIKDIQYGIGGVLVYLDTEYNERLVSFYSRNGFRKFVAQEIRTFNKTTPEELIQMLKTI